MVITICLKNVSMCQLCVSDGLVAEVMGKFSCNVTNL
jgi:hypothetical protein